MSDQLSAKEVDATEQPDDSRRSMFATLLGVVGLAALPGCSAKAKEGSDEGGPVGATSSAISKALSAYEAETYADARGINGGYDVLYVRGRTAQGDGGEGWFAWRPSDSAADDAGTILRPTSSPLGNWRRLWDGGVSVRWFGAVGQGSGNDAPAIQAAIDSALLNGYPVVLFPRGRYRVTQSVTVGGSVTLMGEGSVAGGVGDDVNSFATILHDFTGDLFVFDNSRNNSETKSGGGAERLRLVQKYGSVGTVNGCAISVIGSGAVRPAWLKFRQLIIEEDGAGSWTWAINIDGSACGGIPDLFIGEVSTHTTGANYGAVQLKSVLSIIVYNCTHYDSSSHYRVTGTPAVPSSQVGLVNVNFGDLIVDYARDVSVTGGVVGNIVLSANVSGTNTISPGRLSGSLTDATNGAAAVFYYSSVGAGNMAGSFRFSRSPALANGQYMFGIDSPLSAPRALIGLDASNVARLIPYGDAPLAVGAVQFTSGAAASDLVMRRGSSIRFSDTSSGTNRALTAGSADELLVGEDASKIELRAPAEFVAAVGLTVGGSGSAATMPTPVAYETVTINGTVYKRALFKP